jgi:hypothetical protein
VVVLRIILLGLSSDLELAIDDGDVTTQVIFYN